MIAPSTGGFAPPRPTSTRDRFAIRGAAISERNLFSIVQERADGSRVIQWPDLQRSVCPAELWAIHAPREVGTALHYGREDAETLRWCPVELRGNLAVSLAAEARTGAAIGGRFPWWWLGFCGEVRS